MLVSYLSDRTQNRKTFVWVPLAVGMISLLGSYFLGAGNFWLSYGLLVLAGAAMYAPYGPFFSIIPEVLPRNVAGGAMAFINSFGALGSFVGAYIVGYLNGVTGSPGASFIFMAASLLVAIFVTIVLRTGTTADVGTSVPAGARG